MAIPRVIKVGKVWIAVDHIALITQALDGQQRPILNAAAALMPGIGQVIIEGITAADLAARINSDARLDLEA